MDDLSVCGKLPLMVQHESTLSVKKKEKKCRHVEKQNDRNGLLLDV